MFEQAFKNIDDVLWKDAGCTSELDYTEQTSWLLFLKYLDALEHDKATEAALDGNKYTPILDAPYRWETCLPNSSGSSACWTKRLRASPPPKPTPKRTSKTPAPSSKATSMLSTPRKPCSETW
ncbi:MAG: type I restriction-modification system subunit M N-terminal domain-containing protein [Verrucomicrobiaceae bacterium]|jgi:hypothetical protein|nr:type I restriction-modification system subunit M N-terminal domain-containing protein [Verrucomicrobiaceae bacterium]